jgi:hypothetical protein
MPETTSAKRMLIKAVVLGLSISGLLSSLFVGYYAATYSFRYGVPLGVWSVFSVVLFSLVLVLVGYDTIQAIRKR